MPAAAMLTRPIPSTGEAMPVIGLGTSQTFDVGAGEGARRPLIEALRLLFASGGRMIDSSPMYGRAEAATGDLLAEMEAAVVAQRGHRSDPDPQPCRLAHPSGYVAPNEG
jgi:diketogulonate reductase-like aldo/keto reductase